MVPQRPSRIHNPNLPKPLPQPLPHPLQPFPQHLRLTAKPNPHVSRKLPTLPKTALARTNQHTHPLHQPLTEVHIVDRLPLPAEFDESCRTGDRLRPLRRPLVLLDPSGEQRDVGAGDAEVAR